QPEQAVQQGGLAGTVATEQAQHAATCQFEVDAVEYDASHELLVQATHEQRYGGGCGTHGVGVHGHFSSRTRSRSSTWCAGNSSSPAWRASASRAGCNSAS